jgi:hypothetical protein
VPATTNEHRGRPARLAWALLVLVLLGFVAFVWFDQLLRQAGRPDLALVAPSPSRRRWPP